MPPAGVSFRPRTAADRAFLAHVYATTRADELAPVPWTQEQKAQFLEMQFAAQTSHYDQYYAGADFLVIERDGTPIGRLYIERRPGEIHLIDIALVPEARGAGLGTALLEEILAEAGASGKVVTIHVERFNRALRLYERLGFVPIAEHGVYYEMRWPAAAARDQA